MTNNLFKLLISVIVVGFSFYGKAYGQVIESNSTTTDRIEWITDYYGVLIENAHKPSEDFIRHFTWGLEIGSSVDVTGNDLTTFNTDVSLGYRNLPIKMVGIGFGVHRAFGNGNAFVPLYAIVRSWLRKQPSRFFIDMRAGYSFNTISNEKYRGGFMMNAGLGIVLQSNRRIESHIMLSYGYYHINATQTQHLQMSINHADYAILGFGVSF